MISKNVYETALAVSQKTGIPIKKILDFFYYLRKGDPVDNNQLIRELGLSRNSINQVKEMLSKYLLPSSKNTQLSPKAVHEVKSLFTQEYLSSEGEWNFLKGKKYSQLLQFVRENEVSKQNPARKFDQFYATAETVAKRASLLNYFGDIEGKKLLFLGDDDFTSLACASYRTAEGITVMEIDENINEPISAISKKETFGINTYSYDARNSFPAKHAQKYDIVFTDPPYTQKGVQLFLARAIEAINSKNRSGRIYICYGNSDNAKEKFSEIHEVILKSGMMIRNIFDKFNRYSGAESIGDASSLIICETTDKTKPLVKGNYDKKIYTYN